MPVRHNAQAMLWEALSFPCRRRGNPREKDSFEYKAYEHGLRGSGLMLQEDFAGKPQDLHDITSSPIASNQGPHA